MNTCHSSKSDQRNLNICPSSNQNAFKKILRSLTLQFQSVLSAIWDFVSVPASNEPIVWQKRDRKGQIYWQVYDPASDRSIRFSSEQEVRQWLEQRFYNH